MTASFARIRGNLRALLTVTGALILIGVWSLALPGCATTPACWALTSNVYERVHPTVHSAALTVRRDESASFIGRGFVATRETSMRMATRAGQGLVAVHRLYRARNGPDFLYTASRTVVADATARRGYIDEGVTFYAATAPAPCLVPVWSYSRNGVHRYISTTADQATLVTAGWRKETVRFYAGKPALDPVFSFAVYPDTQEEVYASSNGRFRQRSQWLVDHRHELDLRFVTHIGDVVKWDTPDHGQYSHARESFKPLEKVASPIRSVRAITIRPPFVRAEVPASQNDGSRTHADARNTTSYNRYFRRQSVIAKARTSAENSTTRTRSTPPEVSVGWSSIWNCGCVA